MFILAPVNRTQWGTTESAPCWIVSELLWDKQEVECLQSSILSLFQNHLSDLNQTRFQIMLKVLRHVFWFFIGISLWNCKLWHSLLLLFLPPSLLSPAALCTVRQQYLLLWISFVLIIRINDCLAIWMPHLEKLGSHVTVINYRQAGASPEAFSPPPPAACTHSCWRVSRVGHTADISHMPNCINVRKQIKFDLF